MKSLNILKQKLKGNCQGKMFKCENFEDAVDALEQKATEITYALNLVVALLN